VGVGVIVSVVVVTGGAVGDAPALINAVEAVRLVDVAVSVMFPGTFRLDSINST
jgi:hypothetical protein